MYKGVNDEKTGEVLLYGAVSMNGKNYSVSVNPTVLENGTKVTLGISGFCNPGKFPRADFPGRLPVIRFDLSSEEAVCAVSRININFINNGGIDSGNVTEYLNAIGRVGIIVDW